MHVGTYVPTITLDSPWRRVFLSSSLTLFFSSSYPLLFLHLGSLPGHSSHFPCVRLVTLVDDHVVMTAGIGDVQLTLQSELGSHDLIFERVYRVPDIAENIISCSKLATRGITMTTHDGYATFTDTKAGNTANKQLINLGCTCTTSSPSGRVYRPVDEKGRSRRSGVV